MKKRKFLTATFLLLLLINLFWCNNLVFATNSAPPSDKKDVNGIQIEYGLGYEGVKEGQSISNITKNDALATAGGTILSQYKTAIAGITGVVSLTFVIFFLINFAKLGQSSGNPQLRSQALLGIIWCGIAAACIGGVSIFFGFFYNIGNEIS